MWIQQIQLNPTAFLLNAKLIFKLTGIITKQDNNWQCQHSNISTNITWQQKLFYPYHMLRDSYLNINASIKFLNNLH